MKPRSETEQLPEDLKALLNNIKAHQGGLKEFELLKLQWATMPEQDRPDLTDPLELFKQHFILFHQLYRLNDLLTLKGLGRLSIHTLDIRWQHDDSSAEEYVDQALSEIDRLREYYLNWGNLTGTDAEDVQNLLDQFWHRYSGAAVGDHDLLQSFELFELPSDSSFNAVKKRFRQLMAQHHPDRGGDQAQCQRYIAAMNLLREHFHHAAH